MSGLENLVGFILPPVIDVINAKVKDERLKYVVSLLFCVVVALALKFQEVKVGDVGAFLATAGLIFAEAQTIYRLYWKKSEIRTSMLKTIK